MKIEKILQVKFSTRYWSVVNESDVRQTKSIYNRPNPFPDKIVNNKNIHTTYKRINVAMVTKKQAFFITFSNQDFNYLQFDIIIWLENGSMVKQKIAKN